MNTSQNNVAIYWGTFNPPTLAHMQVVTEVLKTTEISKIIISPSGVRQDKNFWVLENQRRLLIERYIEVLKNAWLNIGFDTHFLEGKNGWFTTTAQEEEYFRKKLGESPWFIFGNDIAKDMPDWSWNIDKFIEHKLQKIFIPRPGYTFDFKKNDFKNYMLLDIPNMLDMSSSIARAMIAGKQSVDGILHPEIAEAIEQNNITYN